MAEVQISRNSRFDLGSHRNNGSRKQTFVFSVQNLQGLQVNSQGKKQNVANNNQPVVQNKYYLRLDSPRTNEAMLALGLNYDNFQQKTQEDFAEQDLDPEIQQMRYEHYLKTLANDVSAVLSKRKQLIESEMRRKGIKNQDEIMEDQKMSRKNSKIGVQQHGLHGNKRGGLRQTLLLQNQLKNLRHSTLTQSQKHLKTQDLNNIMRKTASYLQLTHKTPNVEFLDAGADYLDLDSLDEEDKLQEQIQQELQKYNIKKRQKQLLAKQDYDLEIQRYQELLRIKEKEDKNEENRIRKEIEEFKLKEQKRQEAQDKVEKINQQELLQKKIQIQKKKKIQQKIQKQAALNEQKAQQIKQMQEEKQKWREQQNWRIQSFLIQKELNQEQELYENMENIQLKQQNADYQYKINMNEKIKKFKEVTQKESLKAVYSKQYKEQQEHENLQKMLQKLENKEEDWKQKQMDMIRKEKDQLEKKQYQNERFLDVIQKNKQQAKQAQGDYQKRIQKIQQKLQEKKRQQEREQYFKDEKKKLMELTRKKKQFQLEKQKEYVKNNILEKERTRQQQIEYFRSQRQVLQDTKKLITKELKEEDQRIFNNLNLAEKHLFPWKSYQTPKSQIYLDQNQKKKGISTLSTVLPINSLETRIFDKPVEEKEKNEQQNGF